jgi:uncharacterized membrane protein
VNHKKVIAPLALIGFFLALYLSLWKQGLMGPIACGEGSCLTVQLSEYAYIFGIPVAFLGVGGYLGILIAALYGLQPRELTRKRTTHWILALSGGGLAFTGYLTYLEAFVIEAWCRWCLISAAVIALIFAVALAGLKEPLQTAD